MCTALHEPARLVGADRQQRQIDRTEPLRGCRGRSARRPCRRRSRFDGRPTAQHETAPERAVAIERRPRGEVLRRRQRDRQRADRRLLPPVELLDASNARRSDETRVAERRDDDRIEPPRELAQRRQIAVVVVVVAEQHGRDRRQVVEPRPQAGGPAADPAS